MDACCGLYDEYYLLYIELGLADNDAENISGAEDTAGEKAE